MSLIALLLVGLVSASCDQHINVALEIIKVYFNFRNIKNVNVYSCTEEEGVLLLRELMAIRFWTKISHIYVDKEESTTMFMKGFFIDLSCSTNLGFFMNSTNLEEGAWLGYSARFTTLQLTHLRPDSDVVLGTDNGILWDMYSEPSGQVVSRMSGTWVRPSVNLSHRRQRYNLGGVILKGVLVEAQMEFFKNNLMDKISDHYYFPERENSERLSYVLFTLLAQYYNFKLEVIPTETWGLLQNDGSYNGMIGALERGEAHFGLSACAYSLGRMEVVDFIPQLQAVRGVYMFMEERMYGTYLSLLLPFAFDIWYCIFVTIFLGGVIFTIFQGKEASQGIVFVTAILTQQGLEKEPNSTPGRVYSASLLFLALMLYSYYNTAIMYGLLSPAPESIRSEQDMLKSNMRASIATVPYLLPLLNRKIYVSPAMLNRTLESEEPMMDLFSGVDRLRRERLILFADDSSIFAAANSMYSDSEKCNVRAMEILGPVPLVHPLTKRSPYREMIKQGALRLQETGVAARERRVWFPPKPYCLGSILFQGVSLEAVGLAFTVFMVGVLLSSLVLLIELSWARSSSMVHIRPLQFMP